MSTRRLLEEFYKCTSTFAGLQTPNKKLVFILVQNMYVIFWLSQKNCRFVAGYLIVVYFTDRRLFTGLFEYSCISRAAVWSDAPMMGYFIILLVTYNPYWKIEMELDFEKLNAAFQGLPVKRWMAWNLRRMYGIQVLLLALLAFCCSSSALACDFTAIGQETT